MERVKVDFGGVDQRDWAYTIGTLDWDSAEITFTKRQLVEFLKTVDVTIGGDMHELKRLPNYATITRPGVPTQAKKAETAAAERAAPEKEPAHSTPLQIVQPKQTAVVDASGNTFRPTRKVAQEPGGGSKGIASLFGDQEEESGVLPLEDNVVWDQGRLQRPEVAYAPRKHGVTGLDRSSPALSADPGAEEPSRTTSQKSGVVLTASGDVFRPTRKVREVPGGKSTGISSLFGDD